MESASRDVPPTTRITVSIRLQSAPPSTASTAVPAWTGPRSSAAYNWSTSKPALALRRGELFEGEASEEFPRTSE